MLSSPHRQIISCDSKKLKPTEESSHSNKVSTSHSSWKNKVPYMPGVNSSWDTKREKRSTSHKRHSAGQAYRSNKGPNLDFVGENVKAWEEHKKSHLSRDLEKIQHSPHKRKSDRTDIFIGLSPESLSSRLKPEQVRIKHHDITQGCSKKPLQSGCASVAPSID